MQSTNTKQRKDFARPSFYDQKEDHVVIVVNGLTLALDHETAERIKRDDLLLYKSHLAPHPWLIWHPERLPQQRERGRYNRLADWIANGFRPINTRNIIYYPANILDPNDYRRASIMSKLILQHRAVSIVDREELDLREDGEGWSAKTPTGRTKIATTPEEAATLAYEAQAYELRAKLATLLSKKRSVRIFTERQDKEVELWKGRIAPTSSS